MTFARHFNACINCNRSDVKHMAKGLCQKCYSADYASKNLTRVNAQKHQWYLKQGGRQHAKIQREQLHFNNQREAALERDGHKCTQCGSKHRLTVHHKDGNGRPRKREFKNNHLDNLQTLCRACHAREHRINHAWSRRHPHCLMCKRTDRRHNAKGLCCVCYCKGNAKQNITT